jgi:hypothetical protein
MHEVSAAQCAAVQILGNFLPRFSLTLRHHLYTIQAYRSVLRQLAPAPLAQEKLPQANGPSPRAGPVRPRWLTLATFHSPAHSSQLATSHPPKQRNYVAKNAIRRQNSATTKPHGSRRGLFPLLNPEPSLLPTAYCLLPTAYRLPPTAR